MTEVRRRSFLRGAGAGAAMAGILGLARAPRGAAAPIDGAALDKAIFDAGALTINEFNAEADYIWLEPRGQFVVPSVLTWEPGDLSVKSFTYTPPESGTATITMTSQPNADI